MVDVRPDPKPVSEGGIGRPKARSRSRARTHRETWAMLHARKGGACRLADYGGCDSETRYELHHILSRARAGRAVNEPWNLLALCPRHHKLITDESLAALNALAERLTDEEIAGLAETVVENWPERIFKVRYT